MTSSNQSINLRLLKLKNINSKYLSWFKDDKVKKFITYSFDNIQDLRKYFLKIQKNKKTLFFGIFLKKNNKHIGNIKFDNLNIKKKKTYLGILIGDKKERQKDYSSQAINLGINLLYKKFGIKFFYLGVDKSNYVAINSYKKSGFRIYQKKKKYFIMKKDINLLNLSKFSLGTAQFGMKYGINNYQKQPSQKELKRIINLARDSGMKNIDTAITYGNSEKLLGKVGVSDFNITTKLPFIKHINLKLIKKDILNSIKRLKIKSLYAILLHSDVDTEKYFKNKLKILKQIKKLGLVKKIGISLTNLDNLNRVITNRDIDIIQAPYNIMDQRIASNKYLKKIKKNNIEIQLRSIFLQGLFFKDYEDIKKLFKKNINFINKYSKVLKFNTHNKLSFLLNFINQNKISKNIIIGIDSESQLKKIIKVKLNNKSVFPKTSINEQKKNEELINPSKWKLAN